MGVIAPLPFVDDALLKRIEKEIIAPTIEGMASEGRPFVGILYPGIMLTKEGPKVFEFNTRFGDPEAQTYMRLLDTDILDIFDASIDGKISDLETRPVRSREGSQRVSTSNGIKWKESMSACNVVLASGGYPGNYEKGKVIFGVDSPLEEYPLGGGGESTPAFSHPSRGESSTPSRKRATPQEGNNDIVIFHAGTKMTRQDLVTNGGRVLGVSATGNSLQEALDKAYTAIDKISFEGMQYRKDIGKSALTSPN
ncbi:MAG: hypothetical protein A3D92_16405 [Bacteroidetes bacterium RIFCSPHIGHO2_02_FULL_44_7]|nr:MAG: hypothetical protein A3D92_16405 [Bacteroidetes bacterium RIFCSPHIGHO2_02_FULL_44_7]